MKVTLIFLILSFFISSVFCESIIQKIFSISSFKCPKTKNNIPIVYNEKKWIEACNKINNCITKKTNNYQLFSKNIKESEIDTHHFHADEKTKEVYFKLKITKVGNPDQKNYKRMRADIPEKGRQSDLNNLYNCASTGDKKASIEDFNDLIDLFYNINKKAY